MAFNASIPQANDRLKDSQSDLLANFTAIGALININTGTYLQPEQASDPTTAANTAALFAKEGANTASTELYWRRESSGTVYSVTESTLGVLLPAQGQPQWTTLPSGIILKSDFRTGVSGTVAVTINLGPTFTQLLSVQLTPYDTTAGDVNFSVRLVTIDTNNTFTVYVSSRTTTGAANGGFQYLAIGY